MPLLQADTCPPDPEETAERYLLGRLTPADAAAFEDHYLTCVGCAAVVEHADVFVQALRAVVSAAGCPYRNPPG